MNSKYNVYYMILKNINSIMYYMIFKKNIKIVIYLIDS
jgi:hypothetical protein